MIRSDLQLRLVNAFPAATDAALVRGLQEGILLADGLLEAEPFLATMIGRDLRGHLRRAGIMFRLGELCHLGDLPFEASFGRMPRGNWHWLEMQSGKFAAHLCRTEGPDAFPEETATRQDERLQNQSDLFEPNVESLSVVAGTSEQLAAWLTFGGGAPGQLQHLCWAVPAADQQVWLAQINVLRRLATTGGDTEPSLKSSKALSLKFKEHVEQAIEGRVGSYATRK